MKIRNITLSLLALAGTAFAAAPKTDVVIETVDGILLHVEYVSESEQAAVIDVRDAIFPAALCDAKDLPRYIPKKGFDLYKKLASGNCRFPGNPYVVKAMSITPADIKKRYDTALLTLSLDGTRRQLPFYDVSDNAAWGFNFAADTPPTQKQIGVEGFLMTKTMDTIQTVNLAGERETLHPSQSLWAKFKSAEPAFGIGYSPLLATGNIDILKFGALGVTGYLTFGLPSFKFMQKNNMRLRTGISSGFYSFSKPLSQVNTTTGASEVVADASLQLIPALGRLEYFWDLKPRGTKWIISPNFKLGMGVIFSSVSKTLRSEYVSQLRSGAASESGSYIGFAVQPSLGVELRHGSIMGGDMAFYLDVGYLQHFQDISGSYISFTGGVAYYFGAPAPEPKFIPITYVGEKSVVLALSGKVTAPDGTSIANADIILRAKGSTTIVKQATSNAKGNYSIDLDPGLEYELEVKKDAYVKATNEISLLSNSKRTQELDFILAPLSYSLEGVNFKPDSDELVKGSDKSILELVKFLKANPGVKIEIGGHTAASGADDANSRALSKKRAESVRKFIIKNGIEENRLTSEGYGGSQPIADGKTADGAAKNRRVEVKILTE